MVANEQERPKLAFMALGACVGIIAMSPLALAVGFFVSVVAGGPYGEGLDGLPTWETTAIGLPSGVLAALGLIALGAAVGAIAGRAFAIRPRPPRQH